MYGGHFKCVLALTAAVSALASQCFASQADEGGRPRKAAYKELQIRHVSSGTKTKTPEGEMVRCRFEKSDSIESDWMVLELEPFDLSAATFIRCRVRSGPGGTKPAVALADSPESAPEWVYMDDHVKAGSTYSPSNIFRIARIPLSSFRSEGGSVSRVTRVCVGFPRRCKSGYWIEVEQLSVGYGPVAKITDKAASRARRSSEEEVSEEAASSKRQRGEPEKTPAELEGEAETPQAPGPAPGEIDNPKYQRWAKYGPGSFVKYVHVSKTGAGGAETEMTYTLTEVTPEKVVVRFDRTIKIGRYGKDKIAPETLTYPAKINAPEKTSEKGTHPEQVVAQGTEEITVKGKRIKTSWVRTELARAGSTITETVWNSDDIPEGTVRKVWEDKGDTPSATEMRLVDFKLE